MSGCNRAGDKPCVKFHAWIGLRGHGTTIVNPWSALFCCDKWLFCRKIQILILFILCEADPSLTIPMLAPGVLAFSSAGFSLTCWNFSAVISFFVVRLNSLRAQDKPESILLLGVHLFLQSLVISADEFSLNQDFNSEIMKLQLQVIFGVTHKKTVHSN